MKYSIVTTITQCMLLQEAASFGILTGRGGTGAKTVLSMTPRDQYMQPHFQASTQPRVDLNMSHMVECVEGSGLCSVEEMTVMVEELDRMKESCKGESSSSDDIMQECDLDTVDARDTLRHALESQIALSQARNDMKKMDVIQGWSSVAEQQQQASQAAASTDEDHAFNHFVDYRAIGEYESH